MSSLIYILYDYVIVKIYIIQIETSTAFVIKSWSFYWFLSNSCLRLMICLEQREMREEESKWVKYKRDGRILWFLKSHCCLLCYNMGQILPKASLFGINCFLLIFFFFQLKTFSEKSTCLSMFASCFLKKNYGKYILHLACMKKKITNFPIFLYRNNITTVIHHLKY